MAVPQKQADQFHWDVVPESPDKAPFVLLVEASQGQGKTHLGYTFPQPIFHIDTECRGDKVGAKFQARGSKAYWKVCRTFNDIRRTLGEGVFPNFKSGTIVLDSGSDLQNLAEAEFLIEAKKEKIYPTVLWSKVFEKMDRLIAACRDRGFYVVITARLKPEYANDQKTGALVMEGYKRLPYLADIHLRLENGQALILKNGFRNAAVDDTAPLPAPAFSTIVQRLILQEQERPDVQFDSGPVAAPVDLPPRGFPEGDAAPAPAAASVPAAAALQGELPLTGQPEANPPAAPHDDAPFPPDPAPVAPTTAQVNALKKVWEYLGTSKEKRDAFLAKLRPWAEWEAKIAQAEAQVAEIRERGQVMTNVLELAKVKAINALAAASNVAGQEVQDLRQLTSEQLHLVHMRLMSA